MPKISVIIVTCNNYKLTDACLHSLFMQEYRNFEIIVVDNGLPEYHCALIQKRYPRICLIKNKDNFGPCTARNQGIGVAKGEWILTLDCDVVLKRDFLMKINTDLDISSDVVGVFQPKILMLDKKTIYSFGAHLSWTRRFYDVGYNTKDLGQYDGRREIFGACAAAAVYRRKMLEDLKEKTGYFDSKFFFIAEDIDLAWRAYKKGWKAWFCPQAICYHSGNSSNSSRKLRQYLFFRNRFRTIVKNEGLKNYSKKILPLIFYDLPKAIYLVCTNRYFYKLNINRRQSRKRV